MRKILIPLAALAVIVGLSACDEKAAEVSSKADDTSKVVVKEDPTPTAEPTPEPEPTADVVVEEEAPAEPEPASTTAVVGDTVEVGDWSVVVRKVVLNANVVIHQTNQFNDPPKGQYVLVTYDATYNGAERTADVESDLTWSLTGSDMKIHDIAYQVDQSDDQDWPTEARSGGTVTQQVTFDINPATLTDAAILSVEGYTADFDTVYADFALVT